jgi:glycosyltransferase involved in cell wall biosynthesis
MSLLNLWIIFPPPKELKTLKGICIILSASLMICCALRDLSNVLWGSHIRISELTQSLGATLVHGSSRRRIPRYIKFLPSIVRESNILIFDYNPTFHELLLLKTLKRNRKFLLDIADIPFLQPLYFGIPTKVNERLMTRFRKLANLSDILLFFYPTELKLFTFITDLPRGKETLIVPNAANPRFFKSTPLPEKKEKTILYVGGWAPTKGIELLIDAFRLIRQRRKDVLLKLVGRNIPLTLKKQGIIIERNKFYKDMPEIYSESYLCVIPHKKNPYMDAAMPIKLFDAMASSRPVVVTNCFETQRLIEKEKCGIVSECNATSLSKAIEYLLSNRAVAEEMGLNGRKAIEKRHSWAHRAETVKQYLR